MKSIKLLKWGGGMSYLTLSIIWAFSLGFHRNDLLQYDGNKLYDNLITEISGAFLNQDGELVFCLSGYLSDSEKFRSPLSRFSIKLPINKIWKSKVSNTSVADSVRVAGVGIYIDAKLIKNDCDTNLENLGQKVRIVYANKTKKEMYSFNKFKFAENLKVRNKEKYIVVVVPNYSYSLGLYPKTLDILIVGSEPDFRGVSEYAIRLKESLIFREISIWEYALAFLKDSILFPLQFANFIRQHG